MWRNHCIELSSLLCDRSIPVVSCHAFHFSRTGCGEKVAFCGFPPIFTLLLVKALTTSLLSIQIGVRARAQDQALQRCTQFGQPVRKRRRDDGNGGGRDRERRAGETTILFWRLEDLICVLFRLVSLELLCLDWFRLNAQHLSYNMCTKSSTFVPPFPVGERRDILHC